MYFRILQNPNFETLEFDKNKKTRMAILRILKVRIITRARFLYITIILFLQIKIYMHNRANKGLLVIVIQHDFKELIHNK